MVFKKVKVSKNSTQIVFYSKDTIKNIIDFDGDVDEITIRYTNSTTTVICGIGLLTECTTATLRSISAKAIQNVQKLKRESVAITFLPQWASHQDFATAVLEGLLLGSYKFSKYKSEPPLCISLIELVNCSLSLTKLMHIESVANAVNYARDLTNENASVMTPQKLVSEANRFAKKTDFSVSILEGKAISKNNLHLIQAVGAASATPPALIVLKYCGAPKTAKTTAIIGKGVTFDSGGQNLKPTGSIESMRHDMAGASVVLGLFSAIAAIRPRLNIIGVIPAVHNAIGSKAFFPGDAYSSHSGKTVEIWSTDAEGRLILADAISYCIANYHPDEIIDCATLTGGILSALGEYVAGLFSNNDALANALFNAGETTGEKLWRFPLYKEYCDSIKGEIGDLRNVSKLKKGYASSIIGAAFIKEFVGETPWAHLDIAGTAFNEGTARGITPQFGTGFGVRLLLSFFNL